MAGQRSLPRLVALLFVAASLDAASSSDADVLLKFKATISDATGALKTWDAKSTPCNKNVTNWAGVVCDDGGNVSGLRLEDMNLSGSLANINLLGRLPGLRTLSFMRNDFEGPLPEIGKLQGLRTIFLSTNKLAGEIPDKAFDGMTWLKKLYLSDNEFSGSIPTSVATLPKLLELGLDDNGFSGTIPDFQLQGLKLVNVSNNYLEGRIPESLGKMSADLFAGNKALCGEPLQAPCPSSSVSPKSSLSSEDLADQQPIVIAAVIVFIFSGIIAAVFLIPRQNKVADEPPAPPPQALNKEKLGPSKEEKIEEGVTGYDGSASGKKTATKEQHEQGRLIFVRTGRQRFELQDLLKSSAEVLGTGHFGCTYKAAMLYGTSVVVKRFRDMNKAGKGDFEEHMRRLGRLSHPNLLQLVAYYYRKDEKLLVTDYVPKRSLANALHGFRVAKVPPLDWSTRLKIVRGIAKGLNYLYEELQMLSTPHGHLKSSNVLISDSFEPLLADYALVPVMNQAHATQFMAAYKSPECKQTGKTSKKSDVWSMGILILEIMTGKIPITDAPQDKAGTDLVGWVNSVAQEEWASEVFDPEMRATKSSEGEIIALLQIGLACCEGNVDKRYELEETLDKLEELEERARGAKSEEELSLIDIN